MATKWEYLLLTGVEVSQGSGILTNYPRLFHFSSQSGQVLIQDFQKRPKGVTEHIAVTQMIALLGDDEWEAVVGDFTNRGGYILFKRPNKQI